jgi:hypothetical protein
LQSSWLALLFSLNAVLRHAWRSWRTLRGIAALAIVAVAAGIDAAVAIYTVVSAVLIKPLTFEHGERYLTLYLARRGDEYRDGSRLAGTSTLLAWTSLRIPMSIFRKRYLRVSELFDSAPV